MAGNNGDYGWGEVTLTANSATTTIFNMKVAPTIGCFLCPLTANAALAVSTSPGVYVSGRNPDTRTLTLTHANNAQTDRTFRYLLIGADVRL